MIHSLSLSHFRNFSQTKISFFSGKNIIIGKNGHGKSNILEALSTPVAPIMEKQFQYLVQIQETGFFIGYEHDLGKMSVSYDAPSLSRKYRINEKNTTKQKLMSAYPHVVSFHPFAMNLMYLGPSERREFIDTILHQAFPEYQKYISGYKKILANRNKVLKNISDGKSTLQELDFWDEQCIKYAKYIYHFRKKIVTFFQEHMSDLSQYFLGKVQNIRFEYLSKVALCDIDSQFEEEFRKQRPKELLLRKTLRGPHLDDFNLYIDDIEITHFASRGEIKSILLALKFIESAFLETFSQKKEILFLIDDLLSELDQEHRTMLWEHIGERQCIITCIEDFEVEGHKIFI